MNLPSRQVILSVGILVLRKDMPKKQKLPLFSAMSLCAWLLRQVRPESRWRERVKTLLDDYSDVSLSAMGFPDDWREYALWK